MAELAQHVIVTLVAIWAAYLVITRVLSMVGAGKGEATCDSCPTGKQRADAPGAVKPLTLVKQRPQSDRERASS
ncbi:MAG: hypothetical protein O2930_01415 [Acidobacteria bacterium]|nr:hypothetical protein [Acidobacteriota bacterium]